MELFDPKLDEYVVSHTEPEKEVLAELNRETYAKVLIPRMLAGHYQGSVLQMLSHMIKPKLVIEIGTYTGYSAICWSAGLQEGGKVHTIDINEELEEMIRNYFKKAEVDDKVELHIGNAMEIIPSIKGAPDLVYIDADKENYGNYFDLVVDRVPAGGYIIADNVLWSGKVIEDPSTYDEETKALVAYSDKVHADPRVENVMLPVRDGLLIARKL